MRFKCCLIILLYLVSSGLSADYKSDYQKFLETAMQGHQAFAAKKYDLALGHYKRVQQIRQSNPALAKNTRMSSGWDFWIDLVKKRRQLGQINPQASHQICGIFVHHTKVDFKGLDGKRVKSDRYLSAEMKPYVHLQQQVAARVYEAMSDGKWSLRFKNIDLDATITDYIVRDYKEPQYQRELRYPVLESITPFAPFRRTLLENLDSTDTFVIYSNGVGLATSAGGGAVSFPIIPYQLYSPARGWNNLPLGYKWPGYEPDKNWSMGVLIHEFFHVIQGMTCMYSDSCIGQIHEYRDVFRQSIPDWTGEGELDYYQWRFKNTLGHKIDWQKLNFHKNTPARFDASTIRRNQKAIAGIKPAQLKQAYELSQKAQKVSAQKPKQARRLFERALKLNPHQLQALRYLASLHYGNKNFKKALDLYNRLIHLQPNDEQLYYRRALLHKSLKEYRPAITDFNAAMRLKPEFIWARYNRALTFMALKEYQKCLDDLDAFLERKPDFAWAFYNRGIAHMLLKNYKQSHKDLTRTIELKPDHSWAWYNRGVLNYYHLGQKKQGKSDLKKAAALGNDQAKRILSSIISRPQSE